MKRMVVAICSCMAMINAMAQIAGASHDSPKKNQFTVGEIGAGGLTPELYYDLLHSNYKKGAAAKNKLGFRSAAYLASQWQIEDAEKLDSAMTKRAEIEAMNMADREVDLAWLAEKGKIEDKLSTFEKNIGHITANGGSVAQRKLWTDRLNTLKSGLDEIRRAYMPNANRKKQYLQIYADAARSNEELVKFLSRLNKGANVRALLSATGTRENRNAQIALEAQSRWREAGWKTVK